jgi:hypothetical protein
VIPVHVLQVAQQGVGVEIVFVARPDPDPPPEGVYLSDLFRGLGYKTAPGKNHAWLQRCLSVFRNGQTTTVAEVDRILSLRPKEIRKVS